MKADLGGQDVDCLPLIVGPSKAGTSRQDVGKARYSAMLTNAQSTSQKLCRACLRLSYYPLLLYTVVVDRAINYDNARRDGRHALRGDH
jgi:hypothetical protein